MPVVEHVWPPSVDVKILCPSALVLVARKTSSFLPPASQGRSPSWHCGVPRSHVLPPSADENSASWPGSMPLLKTRPPVSWVRSGSEKPVFCVGGWVKPDPASWANFHVLPPSVEVQLLTWLR